MDVACSETIATPLGPFRFHWAPDGTLLALDLPGRGPAGATGGRRPAGAPPRSAVRAWLRAFLQGRGSDFPGRWELPGRSSFARRVYRRLCAVPAGRTLTYGELARRAGAPGAARAVGQIMARNPLPRVVPCHRVVATGGLGGYGGGLELKRALLEREGAALPSGAPG